MGIGVGGEGGEFEVFGDRGGGVDRAGGDEGDF